MPRILLFDSGVGGLSIHQELKTHLPHCEYHYFADHEAAPYGNKNDTWLNQRINLLISNLDAALSPDIIIIACNTASTLSLKSLRSNIKTSIIGVVPAIKTAAEKKGSQPIGLLATPATVNRDYTNSLINKFSKYQTVVKVGTTELVTMAEKKLDGTHFSTGRLKEIISPFILSSCEHVVLGCTHFPLLINELQKTAPNINWVDSGSAIAKRTLELLTPKLKKNTEELESTFYSSGSIKPKLSSYINNVGFNRVITNFKVS